MGLKVGLIASNGYKTNVDMRDGGLLLRQGKE